MASPTQLTERMSQLLGITWAACDSTWKELRSKNMVVNSGRGKRGTKVTARDCAVFLLALCGADHVKDSAEAAERYGDCVLDENTGPLEFPPLAHLAIRHTLLSAVTAIIEAYERDTIPLGDTVMVLPTGQEQRIPQPPSIYLILSNPKPAARVGVNQKIIAEYFTFAASEMFRGVGQIRDADGGKRRIAASGDLYIEKRVSSATFKGLGELLRDAP